jgi:hypothetical protein
MVPPSDSLPLANGTASAGTSEEYARGDHVHPSSGPSPDTVITAAGFIKTDSTSNDLLVGNGTTTAWDNLVNTYTN